MSTVLLAWLGLTDIRASENDGAGGAGPIAQAAAWKAFDHVVLLCDRPKKEGEKYVAWLTRRTSAEIVLRPAQLTSPTDYDDIYRRVRENLTWARNEYGQSADLTFHLSPGTPPMAVIWILVGPPERAELIQSSKERGVEPVKVPFSIAAEFLGEVALRGSEDLERLATGLRVEDASFTDLLHRSPPMKRLIARARRAAVHEAPVLVEGESGTGKELLARAIHKASKRSGGPFIAVNCGAIPKELVESEFFGHKKGAFTGAIGDRKGHFEQARGGTLFLDEVGELPLAAQIKLLRALQQKKIVPVGESKEVDVDVRIVAATNRELGREVAQGAFREDLYYRLAVLPLRMPALRERHGDITLLTEHFLDKLQEELSKTSGKKKISSGATNLLLRHGWPGNVRELEATLLRAIVWSTSPTITESEMREAIGFSGPSSGSTLERALGDGFDLKTLLDEVSAHYIRKALAESHNNKTKAAKLIGFGSQQLLTQWMDRLKLEMPS